MMVPGMVHRAHCHEGIDPAYGIIAIVVAGVLGFIMLWWADR